MHPHPNTFEMFLALECFNSEKMTFPDFFDMDLVKLIVLGQYLVSAPPQYRFSRKTLSSDAQWLRWVWLLQGNCQ